MFQQISSYNYPTNYPTIMSGKFTVKIIIKKDYVRKDGTSALYLQFFQNKKRKRVPLNLFIEVKNFDENKQRIKGKSQRVEDYNLLIEQKLAEINNIEVSFRLSGTHLTIDRIIKEITNPTPRIDFLKFWEQEMGKQKELLKIGTYKQQLGTLSKIKKYKEVILFNEINQDLINGLIIYCRKKLKNKETTVQSTLKNFKKYLHIANKNGIKTELSFEDISVKSFKGDRTFLDESEIKRLYEYYQSSFISETNKGILQRFLFSCFTGLRISDIQKITLDNIIGDYIAFTAEKTGKFQKIKLNSAAMKFVGNKKMFNANYTNEYINRELKFIAKSCQIKKHLTFHVSRHSFATNYLIKGGRVENLQKLLGHSSIKETMIYVHIVDSIMDKEIDNMNDML